MVDTVLGPVGLGWTDQGIDRVSFLGDQKPSGPLTIRKSVPPDVKKTARRIQSHMKGRLDPMDDVKLDLASLSPFSRKIYTRLRNVKPGQTVSYGRLAALVKSPRAFRAVGQAMAKNPLPLLVPCHRVLGKNGELGGFSAPGGPRLKARLLHLEGVVLNQRYQKGIEFLQRSDRHMKRIIAKVGPYLPHVGPAQKPFDALVEAIIFQQLSVKAAGTIAGRYKKLSSGPGYPDPGELAGFSDTALRACGLSGQKISYLRDLADKHGRALLPFSKLKRLDDELVIEILTQVKGVGRWTAQMFLIFQLDRLDVFAMDDLGLKNSIRLSYGIEKKTEMEKLAKSFKPYRSMASWYLWKSLGAGGL
jgi:O-6-methylguanine DNA methyltransferase